MYILIGEYAELGQQIRNWLATELSLDSLINGSRQSFPFSSSQMT